MEITKRQYQIFMRLNKKLKTVPKFFLQNYKNFIRPYKHLLKPHYILSNFHIKKRKGHFYIGYNKLRVLGWQRKKTERVKFTSNDFLKSINKEKAAFKEKQSSPVEISNEIIEIDDDDDDDEFDNNSKTNKKCVNKNKSLVDDDLQSTRRFARQSKSFSNNEQYKNDVELKKINTYVKIQKKETDTLNSTNIENSKSSYDKETIEKFPKNVQNIKETKETSILKSPGNCLNNEEIINTNDYSLRTADKKKANRIQTLENSQNNDIQNSKTTKETGEFDKNDSKDTDKLAVEDSSEEDLSENDEIDEKEEEEKESSTELEAEPVSIQPESNDADVPSEEINKQLRKQLSLLQMGKRKVSLLADKTRSTKSSRPSSDFVTPSSSRCASPSFRRNLSLSSIEDGGSIHKTPGKKNTAEAKKDGKRNFIDSLINKLKGNSSMDGPTTNNQSIEISLAEKRKLLPMNVTPQNINIIEHTPTKIMSDDECSTFSSSSNNDFFGFNEGETVFERPNIPGLLATPIVLKSSGLHSAFISESLDNFMTENALDNSANIALPAKKTQDEAMMCAEAKPPILMCPQLPIHMEKPRTVAEKRLLLEKETDIKYLMIENEATVYRELRRRTRALSPATKLNPNLISNIQKNRIPFTRDCWRATCWLCTENGKFYYQTFRTKENKHIKIFSGRGNNVRKCIYEIPELTKKYTIQKRECKCPSIEGIHINNLDTHLFAEIVKTNVKANIEIMTPSRFPTTKLLTEPSKILLKPAPLSQKQIITQRSSLDLELGPLEIYQLPLIQIEIWPKLDRPLPEPVKPYLKVAMPFSSMTEEWVKFAVSTVKQPIVYKKLRRGKRKLVQPKTSQESFVFDIPYLNDQKNVLVRKRKHLINTRIVDRPLKKIDFGSNKVPLTFAKDIDLTDSTAVAVTGLLNDMFNSVEIQINEPFLIKNDPDQKYRKRTANLPASQLDTFTAGKKKKETSERVM